MQGEATSKGLLGTGIRILIPLAITVAMVWYMFTKIDFAELWQTVRHGVDYKWLLFAMGLSVVSHIIRASRWRLQLKEMEICPPFMALCCSIFGTYALNLIFPRLGEVWRCTYISRREHASFSRVLGSMLADRLSDTLTVFLLLVFTLFVARDKITAFLDEYGMGREIRTLLSSPWFWTGIAVTGVCVWFCLTVWKDNKLVARVRSTASRLWEGFAAVGKMKGKWLFAILTLAIWGCYFFQLYLAFFAFDCTRELCFEPGTAFGLLPCLVAFVLSSIGMAIPSNGGLGPWNLAVVFGLMLYSVAEGVATSMSIVVWSAQTVMLVILGIYTAIYTGIKR